MFVTLTVVSLLVVVPVSRMQLKISTRMILLESRHDTHQLYLLYPQSESHDSN